MPIAAVPSRSTRETIPFVCCLWTTFSPHFPYLPEKMTAEYEHQSLFPLTHRCQRAIITLTRSDRQQSYKTGRDFFFKPENNNTNLAALVPLLRTHLRKLLLDPGSKTFQKPKTKKRIQKSKQLKPKNPHAAAPAASC
jgi:hypothetical protein